MMHTVFVAFPAFTAQTVYDGMSRSKACVQLVCYVCDSKLCVLN
jgi:hypothetical protein